MYVCVELRLKTDKPVDLAEMRNEKKKKIDSFKIKAQTHENKLNLNAIIFF